MKQLRRYELETPELLAIWVTGAYGFAQSSNYNGRGRAAEVLVDGKTFVVTPGKPKADAPSQINTSDAQELPQGTIIFRSDDKLYIVDAPPRPGAGMEQARYLATLAIEETRIGVLEDKAIKNMVATEFVYNYVKDKRTVGVIREDPEHGLVEVAEPIGVIFSVTPITYPQNCTTQKASEPAR